MKYQCGNCGKYALLDEMLKPKRTLDFLYDTCKACRPIKKRGQQRVDRAKSRANNQKARAKRLNRLPSWLTPAHYEEIELICEAAQAAQDLSGYKYNVDHIVPLEGDGVCGLHVPWNLQILLACENKNKGNKY